MGELRFWRSQSPASVDPFPVIAKRMERKDSSPTIKSILSQFSSAYEASLTFIKDPDKHPFQFVEDSLMLMRCVCPLGVNMLNPSWTEGLSSFSDRQPVAVELGNSGMDEHGRGRVWTPKDRLLIVPADEYSITSKIYYYPSEYLKSGEGAPKLIGELQDGESVVVGRKLKMFSFYGVGSDFALTKVEVGAHVENDAYSRGCLRFLKLNGIFCFNAGARREFAAYGFDGTNWQLANFEGVHEAAGNTMVFGRSQVTRLDFKPNFEDPSSSSSSEKS